MRILLFAWCTISSLTMLAQDLDYGISGTVTSSHISGSSALATQLEGSYGLGGSFWLLKNGKTVSPSIALGFKSLTYSNTQLYTSVNNLSLDLPLGVHYPIPRFSAMDIVFEYQPTLTLQSVASFNGKKDSIRDYNIANDATNKLSHGVFVGVSFNFRSKDALQVGFTHILNQKYTASYIDLVPHHFSLKYNLNFSQKKIQNTAMHKMNLALQQLQNDTLYIINRCCPSDVSVYQLDSLFTAHYTFSKFKILNESEVQVERSNALFYAVIGHFSPSLNDSYTTGIFLLDKDMKHTEYPYPYHTGNIKLNDGQVGCIGSIKATAALITNFNTRMTNR